MTYSHIPLIDVPVEVFIAEQDRRLREIEPLPIGRHDFSQATYDEQVRREIRLENKHNKVIMLQLMMDDEMLTQKEELLKC